MFKLPELLTRQQPGNRIKFRILIPLVLALGVLLATFAFTIWRVQQKELARDVALAAQEVERWLLAEENEKTAVMKTTIEALMNDGQLTGAFRQRDRAALLERAKPLFDSLRSEHSITHFYFHLPDRTVWLRVHYPGANGDKIDRHTMLEAERTGKVSVGFEHGLTGIFTLRVVSPWRQDGQLLGYLELGVEFENIVQDIHKKVNEDVDFVVAVDKKLLDREQWTAVMKREGWTDDWNRFPRMVVISKTVETLPKLAVDYLLTENPRPKSSRQGGNFQLAFLPLTDVAGEDHGKLIVLQNVAEQMAETSRTIRFVVVLNLAVGAMVIGFFYFFLTGVENDLSDRTAKLKNEIAARKQTENALRESNEKFHQLANNLTNAFWIRSPDMREVHYISPAFERIWGRSVESLYANPQRWADFILPEDRERVLGAFAALTGNARSLDIEYRIVRPDGEIRWVRVQGFQVRDTADKLIRHAGIVTDITERKVLEAQMERLRIEHAVILNSIGEGVHWIDSDGRIKYENPASAKMLGYEVFELIGKPAHPTMHHTRADGAAYPQSECTMYATLRDGVVRRVTDEVFWRKDGTSFAVEYVCTPVYDKNGHSGGSVVIFTDITERKRLEAQLVQSQKMETVGKLAGGVAHEFNSIMTVIIGQSEWLLNELPPGNPLCKNATEISKAAEQAATLTRQLLAYGRKQILQPEILDLNSVLAGMEGTLRHLLGRSADVRMAPAAGLKTVKADAGQIEQVIMNLAMNAADAMPNGGKLTLETANVTLDQEYVSRFPELKAGDYVMLAITDTGTGMRAEVKARVFEPFFTTKGVGQGTGLGLSTCYGIVKQSGGHISVDSELARGATFKIFLPQVEPETKIALQRPDSPDLPRGTETILLVEDDPALREMAAALLRRLDYTVLAAANGIEALSLQQQRDIGPIDLLFADVVMPLMSGQELSERMRALSPHTRILFTSAYTEHAIVRQDGLNQGVAPLQKPFTPSALAHKLREVLDQPSAPKPDTAQKTVSFTKISDAEKTPEK